MTYNLTWKKVPFEEEAEEFTRTAKYFTEDLKAIKANVDLLKEKYNRIMTPQSLSNFDWKSMSNTDSYYTTSVQKIKDTIRKNKEPRDLGNILIEYASKIIRAPITIRLKNKKLYLVAGNTRLMAAKVLEVQPKIIIIETDW